MRLAVSANASAAEPATLVAFFVCGRADTLAANETAHGSEIRR